MKKPVIQLDSVWKTYKMGDTEVNALKGLTLEVMAGDFLAVMGPSGSGKSTAMNMIGALDYPTKGKIFLDGHDISKLSESRLAQIRGKKIGFIFQQFNLIGTLTAKENVMLPMLFQGVSKEEREKRAEALLEKVELSHRMDHRPKEMSGGQQQRVAIARSLVNDPEVILADEPTGNLDSLTGENIIEMLKALNRKERKTIIIVTHEEDIAKHAERIEFLKDGAIMKKRSNSK